MKTSPCALRLYRGRSQRNWVQQNESVPPLVSLSIHLYSEKRENRTAGSFLSSRKGTPLCVSTCFSPCSSSPSGDAERCVRTCLTTKPWLILPVAVCLFQRLSHANLRANDSNSRSVNGSLNQRLSTQFCGACPVTRIPTLTVSLIRVRELLSRPTHCPRFLSSDECCIFWFFDCAFWSLHVFLYGRMCGLY